nr:putative ring-h2 finger protein atl21a [Quercus suber]
MTAVEVGGVISGEDCLDRRQGLVRSAARTSGIAARTNEIGSDACETKGVIGGHNGCPELQCGNGPRIRFPFRLKDRQPDQHSGYPGFDLYCSHNNDTVLELAYSVKAFVNSIDYESQFINVTVSDNCFPWNIPGLLSYPPFQFKNSLYNYSLFNCTPDTFDYPIPCFSSIRHPVYATRSDKDINDLPILSCTKMYSVSSVPYYIWYNSFLELTWSEPAECGRCERKGKKCRFQTNSTELKIECFPNDSILCT